MTNVSGRFFRDLLQEFWNWLLKKREWEKWSSVRALGFSFFVLDLNQEVLHLSRKVVQCCVG